MKSDTLARGVAALALAGLASSALAAPVYVFSTGNAQVDSAYRTALEARGHTVTIGTQWSGFDGTVALTGFRVVLMNHSANWSGSGGQVPVAGQQQLVQFVNNGGGVITTEWIVYNIGVSGGTSYATLAPILPVTYGNTWNSNLTTTMTRVTPEPIVNSGLPASFVAPNDNFAGTESRLLAKPGATVFYQSSNMSATGVVGAGAAGWTVGRGRVASLSNMPGTSMLTNTDYATLVSNLVFWAGQSTPVCGADLNNDGELTFDDITIFVALYNAEDPRADFSRDGEWTFDDITIFLTAYNSGC